MLIFKNQLERTKKRKKTRGQAKRAHPCARHRSLDPHAIVIVIIARSGHIHSTRTGEGPCVAREEPSSARAREGDPVPLPLHQGSRASLGLATPSHLQGVSSPPLWRERALHWELRHPYPPPGIARVSGVVGRERERKRV